jgi:hypothetical protein
MSQCQRCAREFTLPADYALRGALSIFTAYCTPCADSTNARFLAIYGAKN